MISHAGREDTRIFREISALGSELKALGGAFVGARIHAEVGLLFDWENWWALELASGPSKDVDYLETVRKYYAPFYENNIPVDILGFRQELAGYRVILAPMLYMIKDGVAERLTEFVRGGGILIATTPIGADGRKRPLRIRRVSRQAPRCAGALGGGNGRAVPARA